MKKRIVLIDVYVDFPITYIYTLLFEKIIIMIVLFVHRSSFISQIDIKDITPYKTIINYNVRV